MGRIIATKMPNFGLNKIRPLVRVRPPSIDSNTVLESVDASDDDREKITSDGFGKKLGRKIMVVIDSSTEAKNALQWTLSHVVRSRDMIILLHVIKPCGQGDEDLIRKDVIYRRRVPEFLTCMKNICHLKRPEVQVEVSMVEGKEKGPTIVEETTKQAAALLILGRKKRWMAWREMPGWAVAGANGPDVMEYCIENAGCTAIAVRRKNKKVGGYLITTKNYRDFWLLA
ncbi:uncharacterized protein LOC127261843 [Andrographis paniculata]|uniref:uncharacterized protein LOC127261843 n=1 Tax=Andrographis paniculata TaxID=175694 RepID=UPI0021E8A737|nr:uncharacterized protein LOC127261843 [Andrographis paniculata]